MRALFGRALFIGAAVALVAAIVCNVSSATSRPCGTPSGCLGAVDAEAVLFLTAMALYAVAAGLLAAGLLVAHKARRDRAAA